MGQRIPAPWVNFVSAPTGVADRKGDSGGGGGNGHDLDDVADVSDGDLCQPSGDETGQVEVEL